MTINSRGATELDEIVILQSRISKLWYENDILRAKLKSCDDHYRALKNSVTETTSVDVIEKMQLELDQCRIYAFQTKSLNIDLIKRNSELVNEVKFLKSRKLKHFFYNYMSNSAFVELINGIKFNLVRDDSNHDSDTFKFNAKIFNE